MLDRKSAFKLPPTTIRDAALTQEARRCKALEEQKLRRTRKFDSARQLDFFADLTLSDDDDDEDDDDSVALPSIAVGSFVSAMKNDADRTDSRLETESTTTAAATDAKPTGKKKKRKRGGRKAKKPSKWADKCMYAELLEMIDPGDSSSDTVDGGTGHGLPKDLESDWVAVGPVPVGKRCLAVTHQSSGAVGVAPNTSLRSRLLGKTLIARFPSALPPLTILDCILDVNWKDNGILHVLDVIKWKGQDVGDCEARFRFWWRDTRLAEVAQCLPSMAGYQSTVPLPMVSVAVQQTTPATNLSKFQFTYPTTFLPIPYFTDTSLSLLSEHIIPLAREARKVTINVPVNHSATTNGDANNEGGMDVDVTVLHTANEKHPSRSNLSGHHMLSSAFTQDTTDKTAETRSPAHTTAVVSMAVLAHIESDGLLLYVAEASYESGSSPLSNWIPIVGYERNGRSGDVQRSKNGEGCLLKFAGENEGPLDLFERLVKRNLERKALLKSERGMDMDT